MNLEAFRQRFDSNYPRYTDAPYFEILNLISELDDGDRDLLTSRDGARVLNLLLPVIKIKNYKTQVPFPENVTDLVDLILRLRFTEISGPESWMKIEDLLMRLLAVQGIQLPTASAYLHFCHPEHCPIVDRNIQSACEILFITHPDRYTLGLPRLPSQSATSDSKVQSYNSLKLFLDETRLYQNQTYNTDWCFRDLDKALMVLGVSRLREAVAASDPQFAFYVAQ